MAKRSATTKDIGLLHQLEREGQLELAPEFQRNSVWPRSAKAYLIDTILCDRPMPLFFFQRGRSPQTGKTTYSVVDGQQRLRAIFEFLSDRFALSESMNPRFMNKRYSELSSSDQDRILNYDLVVQEFSDYSDDDIRDVFVRMNRYVVKLSPQELRHARESGKFYNFVENLGSHQFWASAGTFTAGQTSRFKCVEFSAELAILLIEGPQDKKHSVDLYYQEYADAFPFAAEVTQVLGRFFEWIEEAVPELRKSRFRKPTDLYGIIGALRLLSDDGRRRGLPNVNSAGERLMKFEADLAKKSRRAAGVLDYLAASSRQTDNLAPRQKRIEILRSVIAG